MKRELIKTDNYLLVVDDSEIKQGDWFLEKAGRLGPIYFNEGKVNFHMKKIIAHLPLNDSPALEGVPLLPAIEVENDFNPINEYDKEYLSSLTFDGKSFVSDVLLATRLGYKKAREKYKFTEEDMMEAMLKICDYYADSINTGGVLDGYKSSKEIIQSLSQPKTPTHFEFEMERGDLPYYVIKTTTNSQGQEVACGKYIY